MTNIERFESLLQSVKRPGIDKLVEYIRKSDFYTAPASTRFHGDFEGGLLQHSLNVYDCLLSKKNNPIWGAQLAEVSDDTLKIVALCHDLCKTYFYGTEKRNKKDENGKWQQVDVYTYDNAYPLGHGEKSVFFLLQYIKLNMMEIAAIRFHMGAYECKEIWNDLGAAYEKWPLCLALHEADAEATHLLEKK